MVSCLWDVLGSISSVPLKLWTLIDLAKFRPPLPFLPSAHFPVLLVLQYFCSFPFMFSQQASQYAETVVGVVLSPHLLLPVGVGCGNDLGESVTALESFWPRGLWQVDT